MKGGKILWEFLEAYECNRVLLLDEEEYMKKVLVSIVVLVLILSLAGCGKGKPTAGEVSGETPEGAPNHTAEATATNTLPEATNGNVGDGLSLPDSYPKEKLPLAADAEILDVREHSANNSLEVDYVSDNNLDTLVDYYEGILREAKDLETSEVQSGYMITASMDGVGYTIMLSEGIMDSNPRYAGKVAVSIILSGLEGILNAESEALDGGGEVWPAEELPGVPQLGGYISQIQREDDIVRIEITVESDDAVKSYVGELAAAGFRFDTEPDIESDHMEFLAFKDSSMMNFAYKGEERLVFIEYQK